jgi:hypothetical protein
MILNEVLNYTVDRLTSYNIRHEIHSFDSGCIMVDIWKGHEFYCLQFEEYKVGLSLVKKDIDFSTIPDKWYTNLVEFRTDFEMILKTA